MKVCAETAAAPSSRLLLAPDVLSALLFRTRFVQLLGSFERSDPSFQSPPHSVDPQDALQAIYTAPPNITGLLIFICGYIESSAYNGDLAEGR